MTRGVLALAVLALAAFGCRPQASSEAVVLVRLGDVPDSLVEAAVATLESNYSVAVSVEQRELPSEAFYPVRNRYRADRILDYLDREFKGTKHTLALTSVDVSTTKGDHQDWGVFGLGRLSGRSAVVSLFRLKAKNGGTLRERVHKVVLHEFGHTVGLPHCRHSETCPMQDGKGLVLTVDKSQGVLCRECIAKAGSIAKRGDA